jgi:hypothetical protein
MLELEHDMFSPAGIAPHHKQCNGTATSPTVLLCQSTSTALSCKVFNHTNSYDLCAVCFACVAVYAAAMPRIWQTQVSTNIVQMHALFAANFSC